MSAQICITGIGVRSAVGNTASAIAECLRAGVSGIREQTGILPGHTIWAGMAELEAGDEHPSSIDRAALLALQASRAAWDNAFLSLTTPSTHLALQVIGATTVDEFRKYIERDAALERRFQPVFVNEPTEDEAVQILQGLRDKYERYHKCVYTEEAVEAAVRLSSKYIADRFLPDKVGDLISC